MAAHDQAIHDLHSAIEASIASSSRRIDEAPTDDERQAIVDGESERVEQLLGLAFVAAQVLIKTVKTRFDHLCKILGSRAADLIPGGVMKLDETIAGQSDTYIEVVNAVANLWKHQEEWPTEVQSTDDCLELRWRPENREERIRKNTLDVATRLGLSPTSTGNLRTAAEALGVESPYVDLGPVRKRLFEWAQHVYDRACSEVRARECTERSHGQELGADVNGHDTAVVWTYTGRLADHPAASGELSWALENGLWARTLDRPDDEHLVLREQETLVGLLKHGPAQGGRCHLLYVLARNEGKGYGGRLLDEFLATLAKSHPGWIVECEIQSKDPERVRRLLESRGFHEVKVGWERQL